MRANEFVKKFGWFITKRLLDGVDSTNNKEFPQLKDDLKRLVESHELVESKGGLRLAYIFLWSDKFKTMNPESRLRFEQAIADVESCL